jgi:predicted O-methyltransferase YrrM
MSYISKKFSKYKNVRVIQGDARLILPRLKPIYDYIYIDLTNERDLIKDVLFSASKLIKPGGIIGLNDYIIYDGVIEDIPYGTYQSVNEFLLLNNKWTVDGLALHKLGFYDIYLRSPIEN